MPRFYYEEESEEDDQEYLQEEEDCPMEDELPSNDVWDEPAYNENLKKTKSTHISRAVITTVPSKPATLVSLKEVKSAPEQPKPMEVSTRKWNTFSSPSFSLKEIMDSEQEKYNNESSTPSNQVMTLQSSRTMNDFFPEKDVTSKTAKPWLSDVEWKQKKREKYQSEVVYAKDFVRQMKQKGLFEMCIRYIKFRNREILDGHEDFPRIDRFPPNGEHPGRSIPIVSTDNYLIDIDLKRIFANPIDYQKFCEQERERKISFVQPKKTKAAKKVGNMFASLSEDY
jgi:hypothetical protein